MPAKPLSPCSAPGCTELTRDGRCEKHRNKRQSAAKRGYDRVWQKFRRRYLRRHQLCEDCLKQGRAVEAEEVHHIKKVAEYPALRLVESNCLPLCKGCHSARTARGE